MSRTAPWGANADATMTGADILATHADDDLVHTYIGRPDGPYGIRMREDLATGRWRTQRYEVRHEPRTAANWVPISELISLTSGS